MDTTSLLVTADPDHVSAAQDLAARLGLAFVATPPASGLALAWRDSGLELAALGPDAPGPVRVDLVHGALGQRLRRGVARREPLPRAVGCGKGRPLPRVVDGTAGLGRDAAVLAAVGCQVLACERSPILAALLADGLERARSRPELQALVGRLSLRRGDVRELLADEHPDVVLLDPMFPGRRKAALVRKEMRLVRQLVGDDDDAPGLLAAALATARVRVVVKRPAGAPSLPGPRPPDHSQDGGQTRFDVYLIGARDRPATTPRRP